MQEEVLRLVPHAQICPNWYRVFWSVGVTIVVFCERVEKEDKVTGRNGEAS